LVRFREAELLQWQSHIAAKKQKQRRCMSEAPRLERKSIKMSSTKCMHGIAGPVTTVTLASLESQLPFIYTKESK
jgi:hypothetical protein